MSETIKAMGAPRRASNVKQPPSAIEIAIETGFRLAKAESTLAFLGYYCDNFSNPEGELSASQKAKQQAWREVQKIIDLAKDQPK